MAEREQSISKLEVKQFPTQLEGLEAIIDMLSANEIEVDDKSSKEREEYLLITKLEAQNAYYSRIRNNLINFLSSTQSTQEIYIDDAQFEMLVLSENVAPAEKGILHSEIADAVHRGISFATEGTLDEFSPQIASSTTKNTVEYIKWKKDLAQKYFEKAPFASDSYMLPTNVPGVVVEFFYPEGEKFPQRSLFLRKKV